MSGPERILYTVPEACLAIQLGRSKLYELIRRGEIPLVKVGKSARVPARALREFAERLESEQMRSGA